MKLQTRAIVYLSLVLLGQLAVLGAMTYVVYTSDQLATRTGRAREIMFKGTLLAGHVLDGSRAFAAYMVLKAPASERLFNRSLTGLQNGTKTLEDLVAANKEDVRLMKLVSGDIDEAVSSMQEMKRLVDEGPVQMLPKKSRHRLQILAAEGLPELLTRVRKHIHVVLDRQEQYVKEAYKRSARPELTLLVVAGALLNLAGCFALITAFTTRIINRLSILGDNTLLMSSGTPLHEPIGGNDELSKLDDSFHKMVDILNAARARDKIILNSLPLGIVTLAEDTTIQFANPGFEQMTGFSQEELTSRNLGYFFPEALPMVNSDELLPLVGQTTRSTLTKKNGPPLVAEFTFARYQENNQVDIVCSVLDVTARHEIEQFKRELLNIVSHDLRTPLTSVQSILRLIKSGTWGKLNSEGKRTVNNALKASNGLIRLISNLLTVSKIEAGKFTLHYTTVNVQELMESTISSLRSQIDERELMVELSVPDQLSIRADEERLRQTLINILSNAVHHSPEGGTIRFKCTRESSCIRLSIEDEGEGIPQHLHGEVFKRFKDPKVQGASGPGLGLPLAHLVTEAHKGRIGIQDRERPGCLVWLELPEALDTGS